MEYQTNRNDADFEKLKSNVLTSQITVNEEQDENQRLAKQTSLFIEKTDVILHAFDWPYAEITANAQLIGDLGYRSVLVSPAMKSYTHKDGTAWWQRYQPQDYRVIDNQLGNTHDFATMIRALELHGVRVYADVVFNHMANEAYKRADLQYPGAMDIKAYADNKEKYQSHTLFGDLNEPLFRDEHFVDAFGIQDWKDPWQVQNGRITDGCEDPGLPKLKLCEHVIEQQHNYLLALKKMGVKGFRIDAAKHMTIEQLQRIWTKEITENMHVFGEIITDGGATKEEYELFLKPYIENTELGAYDFPLFNTLFQALRPDGDMASLVNPYSVGNALLNFRSTTFAITHDIPNNDSFQGLILDEQDEWLAYSYILGRDGGVPLIYSDLNPGQRLNNAGQPRWLGAWKDPRMAKMITFHNYVHGETMNPIYADQHVLVFARGEKGIVALNKSDAATEVEFSWHKEMQDIMSDRYYQPELYKIKLTIASKSYLMLV